MTGFRSRCSFRTTPGVMARTDYIVNGPDDCHVFLTASKKNRREGRVFCGRTRSRVRDSVSCVRS